MCILFGARCPACGHAFEVEADCDRDLHPRLDRFAYACPRCHAEGTAGGVLSATSVPTAVRVTGPAGDGGRVVRANALR